MSDTPGPQPEADGDLVQFALDMNPVVSRLGQRIAAQAVDHEIMTQQFLQVKDELVRVMKENAQLRGRIEELEILQSETEHDMPRDSDS